MHGFKVSFNFWGVFKQGDGFVSDDLDLEKTSRCRVENQKLNQHMTPDLGVEPGPYRWEARALITAPSLHPLKVM